jgi:hypothetical protein
MWLRESHAVAIRNYCKGCSEVPLVCRKLIDAGIATALLGLNQSIQELEG